MRFSVKITLCMLGMLSLLLGAGGSLLIASSFHATLAREREAAYSAYQMVLGTLKIINSRSVPSDYGDISRTLEQLSDQNADAWMALRLYSGEERVFADGSFAFSTPQSPALPGNCEMRYVAFGQGSHALVLSGALEAGGETLYLDIARDISPLYAMRQAQQRAYRLIFLLMAGLCAVLSYSLARVLTHPLERLSQASRAIAGGDLSSRARTRSQDEVGLLARDFNAMATTLEKTISQLQDAMERQERFMGSFAHELKTPMTSIIGYADLIRGQTLSAQEQAQAANYIVSEGKRLENLSQKLLCLLVLKNTEAVFQRVSPAALLRGLAAHQQAILAAQGIALTVACEEGECLLEPDLFKSLLQNLWDNARKAMEGQGGRIDVRLHMLPDGCRLIVADDGRGIPKEALAHLTEAFYRVDKSRSRQQGGVGLGLALCQEIVSLHHGSLSFESQAGAGAAVTVELRGGAA